MAVTIDIALPEQTDADATAVPVAQPLDGLEGRLAELRGHRASSAATAARRCSSTSTAARLVAAGVGKRDDVDVDALRTAGAVTAQKLSRVGGTLLLAARRVAAGPAPRAGARARRGHDPRRLHARPLEDAGRAPAAAPERIVIGHVETPELRAAVERAALLAERTNRARDLANMPPNELNPETLAEHAAALAGEHEHLTAEALGPAEIDELGMGALAAVGRGATTSRA